MIIMQQMQYNAPNRMYVLKIGPGMTPPDTLLVLRPRTEPHPLQNPGCAPVQNNPF